jgi:hypothetical protein
MAILKIPLRVGTSAKRVGCLSHALWSSLSFPNTTRPKHESIDHFSLALLYLFPFLLPLGGPLSSCGYKKTVMKKKTRRKEEWTDRRIKDWSEEVMTDGMGILLMC